MKNNKLITIIATVFVASTFFAAAVGSGTATDDTASKVGEVSETTNAESNSKSKSQTAENETNQEETQAETEAETEAPSKDKYVVGDIVETKRLRISYLSCGEYISDNQFVQPKEGNKYIYCEFEFENISDSDEFVSSWDFACFADDNSCEECYWGDEDLSATISSGRKTKGKVYFEVPENAEDIEIEYDVSWVTSGKIIFSYQ